jgi:MFS transporter, OPA family, glycerol-3-phosphate transporter
MDPLLEYQKSELRRWGSITLVMLFVGYAGYYVCRTNLSLVTPQILAEYGESGIDKTKMGQVASLGTLLYAIGKTTNGILTEYIGGKFIFIFGMLVSALACVGMGYANQMPGLFEGNNILIWFMIFWSINRYVQSMGWGGLIKITAHWYPSNRMALILGILSMSYIIGDALARFYLGQLVKSFDLSWSHVFFVSAGTLTIIAILCMGLLRQSPKDMGLPEPPPPPKNVYGDHQGKLSLAQLLMPLLKNPIFWLVCFMNFGLTMIRETLNFWTPTFFTEVVKMPPGDAARLSMLPLLIGAVASFCAGWLADRIRGKHGRIMAPSLTLLIASFIILGTTDMEGKQALAAVLIGAAYFFLLGPYTFCSGVLAIELGGQKGGSTAAGLIDTIGYFGGIVAGVGVGYVAQTYGWKTAFFALSGVAGATLAVTIFFWIGQDRYNPKNRANAL